MVARFGLEKFVGWLVTLKYAVGEIGFDEDTGCLAEVTDEYVKLVDEYGDEVYLRGIAVYKVVVHGRRCGQGAASSSR